MKQSKQPPRSKQQQRQEGLLEGGGLLATTVCRPTLLSFTTVELFVFSPFDLK